MKITHPDILTVTIDGKLFAQSATLDGPAEMLHWLVAADPFQPLNDLSTYPSFGEEVA